MREAVFSMLESMDAVEGSVVVDLFAGSGALGIEALSRGASAATFVDHDRAAAAAVRANLDALGGDFAERSTVVVTDVLRFAANLPECDLLLADPPYSFTAWPELLGRVGARAGLVVAESAAPLGALEGWQTVKAKTYGGTVVTVARYRRPGET